MSSSLTILYFTFGMRPTESKKLAWGDPVQISVLNTLKEQENPPKMSDGDMNKVNNEAEFVEQVCFIIGELCCPEPQGCTRFVTPSKWRALRVTD